MNEHGVLLPVAVATEHAFFLLRSEIKLGKSNRHKHLTDFDYAYILLNTALNPLTSLENIQLLWVISFSSPRKHNS